MSRRQHQVSAPPVHPDAYLQQNKFVTDLLGGRYTCNQLSPNHRHLIEIALIVNCSCANHHRNKEMDNIAEHLKGVLGDNVLSSYLVYLDRNRMWQLPFCHAVFFGLLKNMCDLLFPLAASKPPAVHKRQKRLPKAMMALPEKKKLSKECRDRVQERARNLVSN